MSWIANAGRRTLSTTPRAPGRAWRGGAAALTGAALLVATPSAHAQEVGWAESMVHQSFLVNMNLNDQLFQGYALGEDIATDSNAGGEVWHEANLIEMLTDYQAATNDLDLTYLPFIEAYNNANYDPIRPFLNIMNGFNDDDLWWAITDLNAYARVQPHDASWLIPAENVFQHVCTQWGSVPGLAGGLPQALPGHGSNSTYLNAITNELFFEASIELYALQQSATNVCPIAANDGYANDYLGWAVATYEWLKRNFLVDQALPILDGIQTPSIDSSAQGAFYTYNQGPILGALLGLSQVSAAALAAHGETDSAQTMLNWGFAIATAAMNTFVEPGDNASNTILTETNVDPNSGDGDGAEFKGVFARYLARFANVAAPTWGPYSYATYNFTSAATAYLQRNAAAIWANSNNGTASPAVWSQPPTAPADQWVAEPLLTSAMNGILAPIGLNGPPAPAPPFIPAAPHCTYGTITDSGAEYGDIMPGCTLDGEDDPIFIYEWSSVTNSWEFVELYMTPGTTVVNYMPPGTGPTLLACSYDAFYSTGLTANPLNETAAVGPGQVGCDLSQTITFPSPWVLSVGDPTAPQVYTLYVPGNVMLDVSVAGRTGAGSTAILVDLSASGLPADVTAGWSPTTEITPGNLSAPQEPTNTTITVTATSAATLGQVTFSIIGTESGTTNSVALPITLNLVATPTCAAGEAWSVAEDACVADPTCDAECECIGNNGIWNGTACVAACTTAVCACGRSGGTFQNGKCI